MKKTIVKYLNKPQLLTTISIIISLILLVLLVPVLLFPIFNNWLKLRSTNQEDLKRLATMTENVSLLAQVDFNRLEVYKELTEDVAPNKQDEVRVVSILHELVRRTGLKIEKVTVGRDSGGKAVSVVPTPTTPTAQSGSGLAPAATTSSPTVGTQVPAQGASYKASATFEGSLSSVLYLTQLLDSTKRSIVVTKMNISRDEQTNKTVATINFSLPLASVSTANSSERVELTNAEIQSLEELLVKLTIDVLPTSQPTGRINPFN
ncbi:MAG: hypothetical protein A2Z42_02235 [Candidatus Woykebacteria bacterium RBG_19FT_COMBO_43_10]|uniref:Uncharacterized protein n=1 Tax=Candidatus Woykebacteria bacterium RBG_19FT_COMBO_43_10 TaxID=1802598 RepID=A0A1G1WJF1_9BACT|nr:MAG: hypothetical protein A2Z42_02235 [Candidatus Woykebacteria bacterium RBG_19FT_COMBO_43_10]